MLNDAQVLAANVLRLVITLAGKMFPVLPTAMVFRKGEINAVLVYELMAATRLVLIPMP